MFLKNYFKISYNKIKELISDKKDKYLYEKLIFEKNLDQDKLFVFLKFN